MKTIIVDMDSTLNLFTIHLANWILARGYRLTDLVEKTWDLHLWIDGIEKKEADEVIKSICLTPGFWFQIPVMRNAPRILERINKKYKTIIATVPWRGADNCESEKILWMEEHCPFIRRDQITFREDKWNIPADIIIDDKPETIEQFSGITIMMDYGYNKHVRPDYCVNNWLEIANILRV